MTSVFFLWLKRFTADYSRNVQTDQITEYTKFIVSAIP